MGWSALLFEFEGVMQWPYCWVFTLWFDGSTPPQGSELYPGGQLPFENDPSVDTGSGSSEQQKRTIF